LFYLSILDYQALMTSAVAVVPIILALVQAIKMIGLPNKFAPLVSIAVGILIAFLFREATNDFSYIVFSGILYGLSASGLYSGVKTTAHATNGNDSTGDPTK